jgi:predicted nucleic acid-binding protein
LKTLRQKGLLDQGAQSEQNVPLHMSPGGPMIRVYLDSCCLSRSIDNQEQERVRLETEAIFHVLEYVGRGVWQMIGSDAIDDEIGAIRDLERRESTRMAAEAASEHVSADLECIRRGAELESLGFRGYDSLHIACAEAGGADVLLTTDDAFVRRARRLQQELKVRVANPLSWLKEQSQ